MNAPIDQIEPHGKLYAILSQLGLILGPATVVALFCQFADMSPRNTAAVAIAVVLFVALCLNRSWINQALSSTLVVGVSLVGLLVYYFTYENILIKDTGLTRYYRASNDYLGDMLGTDIAAANDTIWFFGINFHISAEDKREAILGALKRGLNVRYLVVNPDSPQMAQIAYDFDSDPKNLADECRAGIRDLEFLQSRWEKSKLNEKTPGELEIRLFDSTPRMRAYFFDPGPNGKAYVVPYINRVNSPDSPGFLFGNFEAGVAKTYFYGVSKVWQSAQPLASGKSVADLK